ncbi:hypothetical protein [Streptomyces vilmorinianum]|uniref:hypothetical protein n=1 Tax=Streptomyces vilmorinianum TaxID=3051092 RepID=UPI0010FB927C|nr:hypothetical protein [Streptomyces vilmorinianum]
MTRWGLIVEQTVGFGNERRMWAPAVIAHVTGTREEAMEVLRERARYFQPMHPAKDRRRVLYQDGDGFLLILDGVWQTFHCRFTVAELLYDSNAPEPEPEPEREREARPEPEEAQEPEPETVSENTPEPVREPEPPAPPPAWDAGVPARPSWLGRTDLPGSR